MSPNELANRLLGPKANIKLKDHDPLEFFLGKSHLTEFNVIQIWLIQFDVKVSRLAVHPMSSYRVGLWTETHN